VRRGRWFLPEAPDVRGLLRRQSAVTIEGIEAFAAWAAGDAAAEARIVSAVERATGARRELLGALRAAFITPMEPEDVFALSRGIDRVLSAAHSVVVESDVLDCPPDESVAVMAGLIAEAVRALGAAIEHLGIDGDAATASADVALTVTRRLESSYRLGMAALLDVDERSARIGGRELYRRCNHIGELVVEVAERVVYAVVKEA
jgi:uncharacterized protein Yka (UPF0111/DUF47 family)